MLEVGGEGQIFYRRRRRRVKRKSGNIDDFCRRWGSQYSYMVVLDADSVMSGDCHPGGTGAPDGSEPDAGIISLLRLPVWIRCMRAANSSLTRVYGPLFAAGFHFWQLGESHYWGHNAIIRVKPFIRALCARAVTGQREFVCGIDSLP